MNKFLKAYYLLIGLFFLNSATFAQDQSIGDSLLVIYQQDVLEGEEKMELLRHLSFNLLNDLPQSSKIADQLINLSLAEDNQLYLYRGYLQKGNTLRRMGELDQALAAFFKSAETALQIDFKAGIGTAYQSIADVYGVMGNANNAEIYYDKAIEVLRNTTDSISLGAALLNAGDENFNIENYDKALSYFQESGLIFEAIDYKIGIAYNMGNLGMVYAMQDKDDLAKENINKAIEILTDLGDHYPIAVYLTYMADIYADQNDLGSALNYASQSLELATEHGLKIEMSDAHLKLSELYKLGGNIEASYDHFGKYVEQRDSINNLESIEKMADLRTAFEVSQKQAEVDLLNQQKRNQEITMLSTNIIAALIGLLAFILYRRYRFSEKTNRIIEEQKKRSDDLLLNILPEETANELKEHGTVSAKKFDPVTIMFTDFKGFTSYAERLSPEELVKAVDYYFSRFDEIIGKYGLEKIKTVGDSYMCASGLPFPNREHALKTVEAAIEIAEFVENRRNSIGQNETGFEIRIGINTGPVVAGVVGTKKFAYDIWGDAVNIASRMESNSESGKINISETTYQLVKDDFDCSYRGEVDVKNRGKMKMYFVEQDVQIMTAKTN